MATGDSWPPAATPAAEQTTEHSAEQTAQQRRRVANRLKRAQGQLAAVIAAVENGDDCRAVITQLAAVSSAIDRAGFAVVAGALTECLAAPEGEETGDRPTVDEIEKLFLSLA